MSALHLKLRDDGIALVSLDDPKQPVNTLDEALAAEFSGLLDTLERESGVRALVLRSRKPDSFIAGADLQMLEGVESAEQGAQLSTLSQGIQARIHALPMASVAAIHGAALGGGLELALAFTGRIASASPSTRLGLPEVQLGLLPGGGGTQRLPRLVGLAPALDLLLSGRQLRARQALSMGLVDQVVAQEHLLEAGLAFALALAESGSHHAFSARPLHRPFSLGRITHWLMAGNPLGRRLVFGRARARVRARTRGHYPAPERIIDVVCTGLSRGLDAGLAAEARAFGELTVTPQARHLIRLFFASTALKKASIVVEPGMEPTPLTCIGVVGLGLMGAGIARVSAVNARLRVVLLDRDPGRVAGAREQIGDGLHRAASRGALEEDEREAALGRLVTAATPGDLGEAQLVIEAVVEDLDAKVAVLGMVETHCDPTTIFATNTSSLPVAGIASACARPENVVGMHYFSPVERMPLLEVVRGPASSERTVATCVALGQRQGKTVIVVRDGPGFYTSRILTPYLNEAGFLLAEGFTVEQVDEALLDFGFPVGPFALLDEVGIDVAGKVAAVLSEHFGRRMEPPRALAALTEAGRLGRKNRSGFYRYDRTFKGPRPVDPAVYEDLELLPAGHGETSEIAERCVLQMVNEVALCLEQGVIRNPRDADLGAVFGLSFPPFRGGPMSYVDDLGPRQVVARLNLFRDRYGMRFQPASLLRRAAETGESLRPG